MFKIILSLTLVFSYAFATPQWFSSQSLSKPLFTNIGYGSGVDLTEAQASAREDIASQISSTISSSLNIKLSENNGKINNKVISQTKTSSSYKLGTTKTIKTEEVNGTNYVALSYLNKPKLECRDKQNNFMGKSNLVKDANTLLNCKHDYKLRHFDSSWYLQYKSINEKLTKSQFDTFFKTISNDKFSLKSKKNTYRDGEIFTLNVTSKVNGYLSLLVVYEDGKVGLLISNSYMNKGKSVQFPSEESQVEMAAGLTQEGKATKDLYFAFITPKVIDLTLFQEQDYKLVGESEYRFNDVISLSEMHDFTTLLLRTKP